MNNTFFFQRLSKVLVIIVTPILVALVTYGQIRTMFLDPVNLDSKVKELVEIPSGASVSAIGKILKEKNLVSTNYSIPIIARLRKDDKKISAGEYEISQSMTPLEILKKLVKGDVYKRIVTLKPGGSVWELGKEVEKAGLMTNAEFTKYLTDPNLLSMAGIKGESFEGYLYPETYYFSRPVDAKKIIWTMLEEGEKQWPPAYSSRADLMKLSRHDVLTLASIIEKETSIEAEKSIVSSVFHNRLRLGMRLQTDPTVIYGIPNFNGNLTKKDLKTDHPYNTYTRTGLPIGPISNPSATSIKAALYPEETEYLFFVADGRGGHVFSSTLREHNSAVQNLKRIQRALLNNSNESTQDLEIDEDAIFEQEPEM